MSDPHTCAVDRLGERRDGPLARRVGWLQALSVAVQVGCGLGFTLALAGVLPPGRAALGALAAAVASGAGWLALRARIPAAVPEPASEPASEPEPERQDDEPWTLRDLPWAVVTAAAVAAYVVVGLVVVHGLMVVVAVSAALAVDGASLGVLAPAVGCGLAVSLLVEVLVERPLSRRWGIPP